MINLNKQLSYKKDTYNKARTKNKNKVHFKDTCLQQKPYKEYKHHEIIPWEIHMYISF